MKLRVLAVSGYVLSTLITSLIAAIAAVVVVVYPYLIPLYVASVTLRFLVWVRLSKDLNVRYYVFTAIVLLALATFALATFLIGALQLNGELETSFTSWPLYLWASYSVIETFNYLTLAKRSNAKTFYGGALNIAGIAVALYALSPLIADVGTIRPETVESILFTLRIGCALLAASAGVVAFSFYRYDVTVRREETTETTVITYTPRIPRQPPSALRRSATTRPSVQRRAHAVTQRTAPSVPVARERPTAVPRKEVLATQAPRIRVEVLSTSSEVVCRSCGATTAIGERRCPNCGAPYYEERPGLRCPVCGAPLSLAMRLGRDHRVCGVCFSDLKLVMRK